MSRFNPYNLLYPWFILSIIILYGNRGMEFIGNTKRVGLKLLYHFYGIVFIYLAPFHIHSIGVIFSDLRKYRLALVFLKIAFRLRRKESTYAYYIAVTYMNINETENARKYAEIAFQLNDKVLSRLLKANIEFDIGDVETGIEYLEQARENDPDNIDIYLSLAIKYYENNYIKMARKRIDEFYTICEISSIDGSRGYIHSDIAGLLKLRITEIETISNIVKCNMVKS